MNSEDLKFLHDLFDYFFSSRFTQDLLMVLAGVVLFLIFIQFNRYIPFKPLTAIANALGHALNDDMYKKIDDMSDRLMENAQAIEELRTGMQCAEENTIAREKQMQAEDARRRIIRFSEELSRGDQHSKEAFNSVLEDCDTYTKYYDAHPEIKNGIARHAVRHINDSYDEHLKNNDFLVGSNT